jgi:hypothetical protein
VLYQEMYSFVHCTVLTTNCSRVEGAIRRKIRLIESNEKCCHKKCICKGTLRHVFICLRPLGFCLEWSGNCVGSESGQIRSVKLL